MVKNHEKRYSLIPSQFTVESGENTKARFAESLPGRESGPW